MKLITVLALAFWIACFSAEAAKLKYAGAAIDFEESGNPNGIPVVFLHAFPLNQSMWAEQVTALKAKYRVFTFDVRGLGKSHAGQPFTLEFVVDDLVALLDQHKVKKTVLCGLSMGGFVALRALERNPERFMAAVLADTKSEPDSDSSKLGRYKAIKMIQQQGLPSFVDDFLKKSIAPIVQAENPEIFKHARTMALVSKPNGISAALLALTSRTDTTASLAKITVPTLVMQGEFDTVVPLEAAKNLHEKIKGSAFFLVPKAGHLSNLENPQAFNARLLEFLETISHD